MPEPDETALSLPDPEFSRVRKALKGLEHHADRTAVSAVIVGAELLALKKKHRPQQGRPKKGEVAAPFSWKDRCERETGRSYRWCQDLMKAATVAIENLPNKVSRLLTSNLPGDWTDDHLRIIAEHMDGDLKVATVRGLLALGSLEALTENSAGGRYHPRKGDPADPAQGRDWHREAVQLLLPAFKNLSRLRLSDTEAYRMRLRHLPMRADDPTREAGLLELQAEHRAHLSEIEAAIAARENEARNLADAAVPTLN